MTMRNVFLLFMYILLAGCAVGNQYNYSSVTTSLPVSSDEQKQLLIAVEDLRPYVLNGDKDSNFVGLQRGGFGNPFDVTTTSGKPLTEAMSASIINSLEMSGYKVTSYNGELDLNQFQIVAQNSKSERIIWIKVREWKTDIYMNIRLLYDLHLSVYDRQGNLLATNHLKGDETIGGAKMTPSQNSLFITQEFGKKIGYLFNGDAVREAL